MSATDTNIIEEKTVTATLFVPPYGDRREINIAKVYPDDAAYINERNIKISLEELMTGDTVIYFDDGTPLHGEDDEDDQTPDEIIVISRGGKKSCEECFKEGVEKLKKRIAA